MVIVAREVETMEPGAEGQDPISYVPFTRTGAFADCELRLEVLAGKFAQSGPKGVQA